MQKKIYLATSWPNEHFMRILQLLRDHGHDVYNFREKGFRFDALLDRPIEELTVREQAALLEHPSATKAFSVDYNALDECDILVMVYPCGNDAHVELGYAAGAGKYSIVYILPGYKVGLMDLIANAFCYDDRELLTLVNN